MSTNPFHTNDPTDVAVLVATRRALHALAEHVLAADLYRHTGRIGLRVFPGGFGTPSYLVDGASRQLRVEGIELVVRQGDETLRAPITTLAEAGALVDLEPGAPAELYTPTTTLEPEAPLAVHPEGAERLAAWFAMGDEALERFAATHGGLDPTPAQLWPEHFDLAISMAEVNYGVSPGDGDHDLPYAYVGPWAPVQGEFWNESWGRSVAADAISDAADLEAFFDEGFEGLSNGHTTGSVPVVGGARHTTGHGA